MRKSAWITGSIETAAGAVPCVSSRPGLSDFAGALLVRLGVGRMKYAVEPGLYAVGSPDRSSEVFVSANYKLSFDVLRRELAGLNAWILVLDTDGVNVWCAAGKGTFGTKELVDRVKSVNLAAVVDNRRLILPQLSATGVAAHVVKAACGFSVIYGPVRAADLKAFIAAGLVAPAGMRVVRFDLADRIAVIPVDLWQWLGWAVLLATGLLAVSGIGPGGFDTGRVAGRGSLVFGAVLGSYLVGCVLTPCLLPWLPGRAFAVKGVWTGLISWVVVLCFRRSIDLSALSLLESAACLLLVCAVTSFSAMNFTGATTFTSQSGVRRELRRFLPLQGIAAVTGAAMWIVAGVWP